MSCPLEPIGVVRTPRRRRDRTPVQAALNRAEEGVLEIAEPYAAGLADLDGFDYAWLLSWLHRNDDPGGPPPMTQVPFLLRPTPRQIGVFATRGPRRVNPIGLSLVRILDVTGRNVRFAGVDLVDGTPVIDLKPYVAEFDRPPGEPRCGWLDTVPLREGATPADLKPGAQ
ncbi:tRNA-Thr(GGU) m(6)t(6)A37 methyltransferase TsaA [Amycolatopsis echigonensis]|uniref:tRNA-Thr(GGU) m(6)t(6)A37 methyltransferase TsaA n=1 Tax=Amycolatopsis echigonensis TaxID=2576905 RepID=A0A2N3WP29_9PSEU|nr:tRNA (N6-threonylcarbamoyladenosine(37)-N6)-methyltransferase TrmO [Amycolatopsis niigatensis]PKV95630.1 tRNA-Thr(GGU) m(6)t(6)A37 methyltransferase TsaA [Amycolatopsis niigatensis]